MQSVKIGVIGVGRIGELCTRTLSEMLGVEVVGVADADVEKARKVTLRYGISSFYEKPEDLLEQVEAVVVASPETVHREQYGDGFESRPTRASGKAHGPFSE